MDATKPITQSSSSESSGSSPDAYDPVAPRSTDKSTVAPDFFDKSHQLAQQLSRTQSRYSTKTQDPAADDFDLASHLRLILAKKDSKGILRRAIGVSFENLSVIGDGSGLAYAPTMGDILAAPGRLPAKIKAARHPVRKAILADFNGSVRPKEMLLVLGR